MSFKARKDVSKNLQRCKKQRVSRCRLLVALIGISGGCSGSGEDFSLVVRFSCLAGGLCYGDPLPRKSSPRGFAFQKAGMKWWLEFGNFKGYGKGRLFGVSGLELPPGLSQEEPVRCCVQGWMPCVGSGARPCFPGAIRMQPWGRVIRSVPAKVVGDWELKRY